MEQTGYVDNYRAPDGGTLYLRLWDAFEQASMNLESLLLKMNLTFSYCLSIYGFACLFMTLLSNRTYVWALTNTIRQQMGGHANKWVDLSRKYAIIALRLAVVAVSINNLYLLLVALDFTWRLEGGQGISDWLLYSPVDWEGTYLATPRDQVQIGPTSDMYWPIFVGFCLLHYVETFVLTFEGSDLQIANGITLFEHLFAFHEVSKVGIFLKSSRILARPREQVLVYALFSVVAHMCAHLGALYNQNKYRLVYLTILALLFMTYMGHNISEGNIFKFPLIILLGFLPIYVLLLVVASCGTIAALAYAANGFELEGLNYASFFEDADFETLGLRLCDDFYTFLLSLGMIAVQMAGHPCYYKELGVVNLRQSVWVETRSLGYRNVYSDEEFINKTGAVGSEPDPKVPKGVIRNRISHTLQLLLHLGTLWGSVIRRLISSEPQEVPHFIRGARYRDDNNLEVVEIDHLSEQRVIQLIKLGFEISEHDTSPDYACEIEAGEDDEEEEGEEGDVDITVLEDDSEELELESDEEGDADFSVIVLPDTFGSLLQLRELASHFGDDHSHGMLTRSRYHKKRDERSDLVALVNERRDLESEDYDLKYVCVVCHVNAREVISWPCKCLAVCEPCRLALIAKDIQRCVTCRQKVQGVTRVFIP